MTTTRRLAAILAADVAGYSRLMGADEEGTLNRLKAHRKKLIDPKIAEHHGRIVKTTGDGMLVEFGSVVDAVRCAVDVQQRMAEHNADVPQEQRIEFRVGINVGDIIVDDTDIHGDGVNIAARLEALSEPGSICVSHKVRQELRNKLDLAFDDMGEQNLKNIADPVRVHRVRLNRNATPAPALALPDKPSIAVLPFQNMSGDPEQEFFADGMAEDIITALSKLRWFFVIARNSTFAYKGKSPDVRQVARELGVRYVLEGSVRRAGNRLRINVQLVDATTANHIWAERYDREIADIFTVQDEITQSVVATIEPQLYVAEHVRKQGKPTESLDAWGCVVRALWHLARITREDTERAKELLKRAVALSPDYAKAHSLLAWAELHAVGRGSSDIQTALPVAEHHARIAVDLDNTDAWTYFSIGVIEHFQSKHDAALASFHRATELNPNFAMAYGWIASALAFSGRDEEALSMARQAMRMSPLDPFNAWYLFFTAVAHESAERFAEALDCSQRVVRDRPGFVPARRHLAACYVHLGRVDEARAVIADVLRLQPDSTIKQAMSYATFGRTKDGERYKDALREAGLPEG